MVVSLKEKREQARIQRLIRAESLGLPPEYILDTSFYNPLIPKTEEDKESPHIHLLKLVRKPEYFGFTVKHIFNIELAPFQMVILKELWYRKYPMLIAARGGSKSFMLAIYAMLKSLLHQGSKVIVVGAAFRQAKVIFEYCEHIWQNAPMLRDMVGAGDRNGPRRDVDRCTMTVGESVIIALPLGDGQKIRGQRANVIIADEFATIPKIIYDKVVSGFASVNASPMEAVRRAARMRVLRRLGKWTPELQEREHILNRGNQAIISGTANYGFNHFADYWKEYKGIVESKGDIKKLLEVFKGKIPPKFNWRNYSVLRLPAELLPENFMDEEHVARAQVTTDTSTYQVEYGAVFASDSNGFFRRSLIESCVTRDENIRNMLPGVEIFNARIRGDRNLKYVFSVDPASEGDNFSITILELHNNHRRIVYCWTTNRQKHIERIKQGMVTDKNYYSYCARKIRDLMKVFPCIHISMDAQGGGRQISEALHDDDKLQENELAIWEIIDDDNEKWSDNQAGLHILELIEFSKAEWVSEANHGLKKDLQDKVLLFPNFDPVSLFDANIEDKKLGRVIIKEGHEVTISDTLEDVVMEIEALKDELTTIVHTQTPGTNRDHWDTPENKLEGGRKGRLRKDRYSALVMGNMAARQLMRTPTPIQYQAAGGFAKNYTELEGKDFKNMPLWLEAPDWFKNPKNAPTPYEGYGTAVKRNKSDLGVFRNR
jgi:hypothetical protein